MKYSVTDGADKFEFHDSKVVKSVIEDDKLCFIVKYLNIHNAVPENLSDKHMEIKEAFIEFEGFELIYYTIGTPWKYDENGKLCPEGDIIYHTHNEGTELLRTAMNNDFTVISFYVEELENHKTYELSCVGHSEQPFFEFRFRADSMKISWDEYISPAWYEK